MLESGMLQRLLDVAEPWMATDCRLDPEQRRVSVRIGPAPQRGWFVKREVAAERELHWRHLDILGWRCDLTLALPEGAAVPDLPWAGAAGEPFTNALAAKVADGLRAGISADALAPLLGLPVDSIKALARSAGLAPIPPVFTRRAPLAPPTAPAATAPVEAVAAPREAPVAVAEPADIPDAASPLWLALATGAIDIDIRLLGLKLLLNRIRGLLDTTPDPAERDRKARELHDYFLRNPRQLAHETGQLLLLARRMA